MDNEALRTEIERMAEKLKGMEGRKRWNSLSNERQYIHQVCLRIANSIPSEFTGLTKEIKISLFRSL